MSVEQNIKPSMSNTIFTPTNRFWSINFHITVVQILAIILAIILKLILFSCVYPLAKTCGFCNRPQVKKDNGYMKVNRPKSIGRGDFKNEVK